MENIPKKYYLDDVFDNFLVFNDKSNMKCDIYEKDNKYYIENDLPGFSKDDIKISISDGYLTISAEKNISNDDDSKNYVRRERTYNKYQRSFYVGNIDRNEITAKLADGTLKVVIPKKENQDNQKYIDIE